MKTFNRICIKDFEVKDGAGNVFEVKRGKEYLTSDVDNNHVVVFSDYWVPIPVDVFAGEQIFTTG